MLRPVTETNSGQPLLSEVRLRRAPSTQSGWAQEWVPEDTQASHDSEGRAVRLDIESAPPPVGPTCVSRQRTWGEWWVEFVGASTGDDAVTADVAEALRIGAAELRRSEAIAIAEVKAAGSAFTEADALEREERKCRSAGCGAGEGNGGIHDEAARAAMEKAEEIAVKVAQAATAAAYMKEVAEQREQACMDSGTQVAAHYKEERALAASSASIIAEHNIEARKLAAASRRWER